MDRHSSQRLNFWFNPRWIAFSMVLFSSLGCNTKAFCHSEASCNSKRAALVNTELGLEYLAKGQVARAKNKLNHALALSPKSAEVHGAMAYFLEQSGEIKEAEKEHQQAIYYCKKENRKERARLTEPRDSRGLGAVTCSGAVYNNYGAFLCRQSRFEEADLAFKRSLQDKHYERIAEVYENAGRSALKWEAACTRKNSSAERRTSLLTLAEQYFTSALQHDPRLEKAQIEITHIQHRLRHTLRHKNHGRNHEQKELS